MSLTLEYIFNGGVFLVLDVVLVLSRYPSFAR